jgi:hypothetical protein
VKFRYLCALSLLLAVFCFLNPSVGFSQSLVSGEVDGTVLDSSGAAVPGADVNLSGPSMGFNESTTTSVAGTFRFALVKPGQYTLTVSAANFTKQSRTVTVSLGQVTTIPVKLEIGARTETIEVTSEGPLLHTENANLATTVDAKTIELIPSPGQDITNFAMTTPGVTLSTGAGYGNLTANGLPGTSNLYTVNGTDYNDPYLNLNNSGASNLLLGANELQEITVVTNGYTGEYGRAAGANVNYTTKSGSNAFHGNATWYWNGRYLNANDWFNNGGQGGTTNPRPFANSNQWAGNIGGPIKKDKLFFFYDNEGLRYVLPGGGTPTFLPTTAFANAVMSNLQAKNPNAVPFYTTIFKLYSGAPGASGARPLNSNDDSALGCGLFAGPAPGGGTFGVDTPCAATLRSAVNNLNTERLQSFTVDWNVRSADTVRFRYKQDRGVQATGTDPINSLFNANSVQPEDDGQMVWTHTINPHTTNQFVASGLYYSALFGPPNINGSLALFPTTIAFGDGLFSNMGGTDNAYPQGRNVAQYQFVDDFSWTRGNHGIKFGVNYRRNNLSSFAAGPNTSGLITINDMNDFYNGTMAFAGNGSTMGKSFAKSPSEPISYYSLGLYIQDEWRATSKLKLTLAVRADRNSAEICHRDCFARLANPFGSIPHDQTIPYNQAVVTGLNQAFPSLEKVVFSPRGGFAYSLRHDLVIRGGLGLFSDLYPGFLADRFITNLPNVTSFTIAPSKTNDKIPLAPGTSLNGVADGFTQAAASNAALQNAFAGGGTLASIQAVLPSFSAPNFNSIASNVKNPKYLEWNLMVEKSFGSHTSLAVNYVGNHGYDLFINNVGLNTYCAAGNSHGCPASLPATAPDQRFANISEISNSGVSNYDGLTTTVTHRFGHGLQGIFNYTYSHSLDDLSNGGLLPYSTNTTGDSFRIQIDPYNLHSPNYGNSDYDFRHSISANYFYELPIKSQNHFLNAAIGGWAISQTVFFRTGQPFTIYRSGSSFGLHNGTNERVLGEYITGPTTCTDPNTACLSRAAGVNFAGTQTNFGNTGRNFFRGPHYFNSDFSIFKTFQIRESGMGFTLVANAYNVFNHPNFANPINSLSSGAFGLIQSTVTEPNSPYGNFQGAAVSGRVLQLGLKFKF